MPTVPQQPRTPGLMHVHKGHPSQTGTGLGWLIFAASMLSLAALVNILWGVISIADDAYWGGDSLVAGHQALWGWVWIGFGLLQLMTAGAVLARNGFGLLMGIGLAGLNILGHVTALDQFPGWALLVICADLLVIYALATPWLKSRS